MFNKKLKAEVSLYLKPTTMANLMGEMC